MKTIDEYLDEQINEQLCQAVLSGSKGEGPSKAKIRPVEIKGQVIYQVSETVGTKVLHRNYHREELIQYLKEGLQHHFSQLQSSGMTLDGTVLVSKKGKVTIKTRRHPGNAQNQSTSGKDKPAQTGEKKQILAHNRVKQYILKENTPVPFLVDLGVMNKEGRIITQKYDKFRQINRFLEFIRDVSDKLPKDKELTIVDFGCGKSYLTFAMYYYLHELKHYDVRIIGLDLKADVIVHCQQLAEDYGYEKLTFLTGDIADYDGVDHVDMVVTLHACDTATDYALDKAVRWGAKVILSVPCCQHEVNRQIENELLQPVLKYGLIKERMSALLTDAIRANLLEEAGYQVQVLEFIDMEHTPKNILLRAVKSGRQKRAEELTKMMEELHVSPTLAALMREERDAADA